jgi:hypothetical protein
MDRVSRKQRGKAKIAGQPSDPVKGERFGLETHVHLRGMIRTTVRDDPRATMKHVAETVAVRILSIDRRVRQRNESANDTRSHREEHWTG